MSNKHETYISRSLILGIIEVFDIMTNEAGEASFESFCKWRELYDLKFKDKIGKFDIQSQVSMFDHDLRSLYYDKTETVKFNREDK